MLHTASAFLPRIYIVSLWGEIKHKAHWCHFSTPWEHSARSQCAEAALLLVKYCWHTLTVLLGSPHPSLWKSDSDLGRPPRTHLQGSLRQQSKLHTRSPSSWHRRESPGFLPNSLEEQVSIEDCCTFLLPAASSGILWGGDISSEPSSHKEGRCRQWQQCWARTDHIWRGSSNILVIQIQKEFFGKSTLPLCLLCTSLFSCQQEQINLGVLDPKLYVEDLISATSLFTKTIWYKEISNI